MAQPTIGAGDAAALRAYVYQQAPRHQLDPAAVMAVAAQEGLGGGIGDQGTSFGPWQLHEGGALPAKQFRGAYSQDTNAWAWSPQGVDYVLSRMAASGARGQQGFQAISTIVSNFERPANPSGEITRAQAAYAGQNPGDPYTAPPRPGGAASGGTTSDVGLFGSVTGAFGDAESWFGRIGSGAENWLTGGVADVLKVFTAFLWLANPINWLRAFEALVGLLFVLLGLASLGSGDDGGDVDVRSLLKDPRKTARQGGQGASNIGKRAASGSLIGKTATTVAKVAK